MDKVDLKKVYGVQYNTKEEVLDAVKDCVDGILSSSSDDIRRDKELILKVFSWSGDDYEYISNNLKNDAELAFAAVKTAGFSSYVLKFIGEDLKRNKEFFIKMIKWLEDNREYDDEILYCSDELKKDIDFAKSILKIAPSAIKHFDESVQNSNDILLYLSKVGGHVDYNKLNDDTKNDKTFVLKTIKNGNKSIYDALSDVLKNDDDICFEYLKNNLQNIAKVPECKRANEQFMFKLIKSDLNAIPYCADNLKTNEFYLSLIKDNAKAYDYVPLKLRMDKNFALQAYKTNAGIYDSLLEKFKDDEDFK